MLQCNVLYSAYCVHTALNQGGYFKRFVTQKKEKTSTRLSSPAPVPGEANVARFGTGLLGLFRWLTMANQPW